jgi:hypothetical protein
LLFSGNAEHLREILVVIAALFFQFLVTCLTSVRISSRRRGDILGRERGQELIRTR